ncbi:phage major capsid protein [Paenibacillus vandeheii]
MTKKKRFTLDLQLFAETSLQALLQTRAQKIQKQSDIIEKARAEGGRDLTEDEAQDFDSLDTEIQDLEGQIEAKKKQNDRENSVNARMKSLEGPAGQPFRPSNFVPGPEPVEKKESYGFASIGEFVNAVRFGDSQGRLESIRNDLSMGTSESGGYAVPEQFRDELLRLTAEQAIVRPRANVIPPGTPPDSKITIPVFEQGAKGAHGGVTVQWIGEGEEKPKTDAKLDVVTLEPYEVAATIQVTDKLLRNWGAANAFIRNLLSQAMVSAEDAAFIAGDGVEKPTGFIDAAGRLVVNRTTANQISYEDAVLMLSKLLPASMGDALFIASQSAMPQVMTLKDPAGNYIFIQGDATKGVPSTLLGIPIRFTGKTKTVGKAGDLVLVDLGYYLVKDGSGPFIAASEHVLFTKNQTIVKCFWNVDGKPWVKTPLTLEDGETKVSPYVVLGIPTP